MGETTGIEWTDATWTPVRARRHDGFNDANDAAFRPGWHCEHVSEGCRNCYAETLNKRLGTGLDYKPGHLAPRGPVEMFLDEKLLLAPLKWRKPKRVFVCSMTDLFADFVPDSFIDRMFAVMALCPQHVFQVLTKRPERMREYLTTGFFNRGEAVEALPEEARHYGWPRAQAHAAFNSMAPLPNVWLGVSVEDQAAADARIPLLLDTPSAKRFLSCEPLLGAVDLTRWVGEVHHHPDNDRNSPAVQAVVRAALKMMGAGGLDWVIAGGESGPGARPMHPDWARGLRDQCAAAGVPFFFKQWGEFAPCTDGFSMPAPHNLAWVGGKWVYAYLSADAEDPVWAARVGKKRAPNSARDRFQVRCDGCGHELALAVGDLTDGGTRQMGWVPVGYNEHRCPGCVRKAAAVRRRSAAKVSVKAVAG